MRLLRGDLGNKWEGPIWGVIGLRDKIACGSCKLLGLWILINLGMLLVGAVANR